MQMKQRDEVKRSKLWVAVMSVSSVIIIVLVACLVKKSITHNPLEGEWLAEDETYRLEADDDEITIETTVNGHLIEVDFSYTLAKKDKILTLKSNAMEYAEVAEDTNGALTAGEVADAVSELAASYNYSVERGKLTLTEREFGNRLIFTRIEE